MQSRPFEERVLGGGIVIELLAAGWATSDLYRHSLPNSGFDWMRHCASKVAFNTHMVPSDTLYMEYRIEEICRSRGRTGEAIITVDVHTENKDSVVCCAAPYERCSIGPNQRTRTDPWACNSTTLCSFLGASPCLNQTPGIPTSPFVSAAHIGDSLCLTLNRDRRGATWKFFLELLCQKPPRPNGQLWP